MDFLSNTSSNSISEKQPLLLNKPVQCSPIAWIYRYVSMARVPVYMSFVNHDYPIFLDLKKKAVQVKMKAFLSQQISDGAR